MWTLLPKPEFPNFVKIQDFVGLEITPKALMFEDFCKMPDLMSRGFELTPENPHKTLESKFC